MKKLFVLILAVTIILAIAGCGSSGPANGTYRSEGLLGQTWTFIGRNEITMSAAGGFISTSGTYMISGTRISITTTVLGIETTVSHTITNITRNSFYIDGARFVRQ